MLVALAAALWRTDALLRQALAGALPAATIVFWEHLIIVVVLVPFLPAAARAFRAASGRERASLVVIGAGASAVATALFTEAFRYGDPISTPPRCRSSPPRPVVLRRMVTSQARSRPWCCRSSSR